jgi:hypothetical protein
VVFVSVALRDLSLCFLEDFFEESKLLYFKRRKAKRKPEKVGFAIGEGLCLNERMDLMRCSLAKSFSPTDLAATSLGTCLLTIMGIADRRHGIHLWKTTVKILKEMTA